MTLNSIFNKKTIYISLFAILYISVALVSTIHAIDFFGLSNGYGLALMLACTFEIGQAAVLFSILTSRKDRGRMMPWILMALLTLVQILGNVYSSYKYIVMNSPENLRFFKEPVFVWTSLPDDVTTVILTYIAGGILPVIALSLTGMLSNYLSDLEDIKQESIGINEPKVEPIVGPKGEPNGDHKVEPMAGPNVVHKGEPNGDHNGEHKDEPNVAHKVEPNVEHKDEPMAETEHEPEPEPEPQVQIITEPLENPLVEPEHEHEPQVQMITEPLENPLVEPEPEESDVDDIPIEPIEKRKSGFLNL